MSLGGLRIFVLEDEPIVAMMLEDMLLELDCRVVGPASTLEAAFALVALDGFDAAILDVNIGGRRSDPVAARLKSQRIPYLFATGYGSGAVPDRDAIILHKPYTIEQVANAIRRLSLIPSQVY